MLKILNKRIVQYSLALKKKKKFPAFASGAEYRHFKKVAYSGDIKKEEIVNILREELEIYGEIGEKFENSSIGFCAETAATNRVLIRYPNRRNSINVGIAIRPKTMQRGKKCKICKKMF